jgi:hypothetical protein
MAVLSSSDVADRASFDGSSEPSGRVFLGRDKWGLSQVSPPSALGLPLDFSVAERDRVTCPVAMMFPARFLLLKLLSSALPLRATIAFENRCDGSA